MWFVVVVLVVVVIRTVSTAPCKRFIAAGMLHASQPFGSSLCKTKNCDHKTHASVT